MNYKALKYIPLSVIIIALFQLISCTPQACQEETESRVKATFYINGTDSIKAPDSLTVYGMGMDTSKIYDKSSDITIARIPLNTSADSCSYIFRINGITDTLTFTYTSYPHLISKECGFTYYHILDSYTVTGRAVDTILIRNRNITTINEENIRIFY
jgi:hypothetical protein